MNITIGIVAKNEERYLERLFSDIRSQTYPHSKIEVLLIYGESKDRTYELMTGFADEAKDFMGVTIYKNSGRQSAGWNIAIKSFSTDALVRIDAHSSIADDFIESTVRALEGESVVGGARPPVVDSNTDWAHTLYMAEQSMFGSGVLSVRRKSEAAENEKKYVKTIFHACYRREVFDNVGYFREDLGRTEDNEFHYRIAQAGYRIYMSDDISSYQYIRPTLRGMLRQKAGNGFWVGRTLGICPRCLSLYHFAPCAFVFIMAVLGAFAIYGFPGLLQIFIGLYFSAAVLMSIAGAYTLYKEGKRVSGMILLLPFVFFLLHTVYGAATIAGVLSIPFRRSRE